MHPKGSGEEMILLKARSCTIIFLMTICTVIFLTHLNESVAFALDIKEMVTIKPGKEGGPEKVELNSYFFFKSLGKQFDKQIKDHDSVEAIPFCLNNGRVFGVFAQYANLSYLAEDQLIDEVLRNSYGIFLDFPRNQLGRPLRNNSLKALHVVFQSIAKYHAIKSGISSGSAKSVESDIQSWLKYFFNSAAQANPNKANYLADQDRNGLIEFISDYDIFVMQYYEGLRIQVTSAPLDEKLGTSIGILKSSY